MLQGDDNYFDFYEPTGIVRKHLHNIPTDVQAVANGPTSRGVGRRALVGLLDATCYEWTVIDLACLALGPRL